MDKQIVLRAEIPQLRYKDRTEIYLFFKDVLGDPIKIDEYDGTVIYFEYEGIYQPVWEHKTKKWGVELILDMGIKKKSGAYEGISISEINTLSDSFSKMFGVLKEDIKLISYDKLNDIVKF